MLTGVSGVGPKVALAIMGTIKSDTLISAIATGDAKTIATAPGVGKKMAEKIIVELKNKVGGASATLFAPDTSVSQSSALPDLLMALESLGYRRLDIIEMAQKLVNENPDSDVSKLVPMALKEISKGK
jgi:Holliday junction DNA helicase RuvA